MHCHDADGVDDERFGFIERVDGTEFFTDDHGIEAVEIAELFLPAHQFFKFGAALQFKPIRDILRDDDEEREVDRVNPFAQDRALPAALPRHAAFDLRRQSEKGPRILEMVAARHTPERLAGLQRLTIAGVDVSDLPLRHRHQRRLVNAVLPPPESKVQSTAQQIDLISGLAVEREDAPVRDRALARPELFDHPHTIVGDVPRSDRRGNQE